MPSSLAPRGMSTPLCYPWCVASWVGGTNTRFSFPLAVSYTHTACESTLVLSSPHRREQRQPRGGAPWGQAPSRARCRRTSAAADDGHASPASAASSATRTARRPGAGPTELIGSSRAITRSELSTCPGPPRRASARHAPETAPRRVYLDMLQERVPTRSRKRSPRQRRRDAGPAGPAHSVRSAHGPSGPGVRPRSEQALDRRPRPNAARTPPRGPHNPGGLRSQKTSRVPGDSCPRTVAPTHCGPG